MQKLKGCLLLALLYSINSFSASTPTYYYNVKMAFMRQ